MPYKPARLIIRKVAGGISLYPPDPTTTDRLLLYANITDTKPHFDIIGNTGCEVHLPTTGTFTFVDGVAQGRIYNDGTDFLLECQVNNKDLFLKTTGAGYIKFGTRTATGDVAVNGHLDIKDAAGNVVKLATVA